MRDLVNRFPRLQEWESGKTLPTMKQLEQFARRAHAPIGYIFLAEPPDEPLPIPDFRSIRDEPAARASVDLLDIIYARQQRQSWYGEYAKANRDDPNDFLGSITPGADVVPTASYIRDMLGLDLDAWRTARTWDVALWP